MPTLVYFPLFSQGGDFRQPGPAKPRGNAPVPRSPFQSSSGGEPREARPEAPVSDGRALRGRLSRYPLAR